MNTGRRDFLKAATAAGCFLPFSGIADLAFGDSVDRRPLLVVVFLRGGADGLQLVAPTDDPDYIAARPPELRVLNSGERAGHRLVQSLDRALDFRLHFEAAPLARLYESHRLAIVHAVGLTAGTRSHFVAQDLIERGIADEKRLGQFADGWLARALAKNGGRISALSTTASPAFSLRGLTSALATPDLSSGSSLPWGRPTSKLLRTLYMTGQGPAHTAGLNALDMLDTIDRQLPKDGTGKVLPYRPEGNASYEGTGDLARSLTSVARLARMEVGLTAACVDHGGWDTHENQPGRLANQVRQLSLGLAAFHDDLAASDRKAVILVMTEFGRRLRANKSNGTDHGHGSCWLILGDGVDGGKLQGQWPGLATSQLDQGVDLAVTTDYRTVLAEVLTATGMAIRDALPDRLPSRSPSLFRA
jgi:uncharacterized protein (DUF1501 family)